MTSELLELKRFGQTKLIEPQTSEASLNLVGVLKDCFDLYDSTESVYTFRGQALLCDVDVRALSLVRLGNHCEP